MLGKRCGNHATYEREVRPVRPEQRQRRERQRAAHAEGLADHDHPALRRQRADQLRQALRTNRLQRVAEPPLR